MNDIDFMTLEITPLEKDIIKEIVTIGIAKAADSFAVISKQKVLLEVPEMRLLDDKGIADFLLEFYNSSTIIQSEIKGDFKGETFIFFTEKEVDKLEAVGCQIIDCTSEERKNFRESLLLEISNILTGSLVTQLANIFKVNIYGSVPKLPVFSVKVIVEEIITNYGSRPVYFTVKTSFLDPERHVNLPLLMVFDANSLMKMLTLIRKENYRNFRMLIK